jgi:hypothetical protein
MWKLHLKQMNDRSIKWGLCRWELVGGEEVKERMKVGLNMIEMLYTQL